MDQDLSKYQLECCDTLTDNDVLEISRKALKANQKWLEENDLVDRPVSSISTEIVAVAAAWGIGIAFVVGVFALQALN